MMKSRQCMFFERRGLGALATSWPVSMWTASRGSPSYNQKLWIGLVCRGPVTGLGKEGGVPFQVLTHMPG